MGTLRPRFGASRPTTRGVALALAPALLCGALVLGAYGPALRAEFVSWDDPEYVTDNPNVQAHRAWRWLEILDPRVLVVREWTPTVTATHIFERHLVGTDPTIYHATNLVLQLCCALAAFALLQTLGVPRAAALGAAAWYAVHPLQVESVAWVAARKNLLSTLLVLLAARVYLGSRSRRHLAGALGLFLLALTSKATAVALPGWLAGIHLLRRDRPRARWLLALAPFLVAALARGLYSIVTQAPAVQDTEALGLAGRLAVMGPVLLDYGRDVLWPSDLALVYAWPILRFSDPGVWGAWAAVLGLVAALAVAGRKDRRVLELGLLIAAALFPTLNILPAPFLQADRYLHLALVGVAGLLAVALVHATAGRARLSGVLLLAWALVLVPVSRARTHIWHDSERLWGDTLARVPDFAPGHSNLGLHLLAQGRLDEATAHFRRALQLQPGHARWQANLAGALVEQGELDEARRLLEEVAAESPSLAEAYGTLAAIALREGRAETALELAQRGAALRPGDPSLEVHIPEALAALGRREEAIAHYEEIARTYPIPQVLLGWAEQEHLAGHLQRAEDLYRRVLENWPGNSLACYNLATMRLSAGDASEGLRLYDSLLAREPGYAAAHNNRGNALVALGRLGEARESYARAVALAPTEPSFRTNLANVIVSLRGCNEALPVYEEALALEPSSAIARLNRAACLVRTGRAAEAQPILRALLAEGVYREQVEELLTAAGGEPVR